jgi:hypothetical protein
VTDDRVTAAALRQHPGAEVWVQARVAVHGPFASVGRSDAELCVAFSTVQGDETDQPAAAAAAKPSLLELVACYAANPKVRHWRICCCFAHSAIARVTCLHKMCHVSTYGSGVQDRQNELKSDM